MITAAEIEKKIQTFKDKITYKEELTTLQGIFNEHREFPAELVSQLEMFLADRWEDIKKGELPSYTEKPNDEITKLMMSVAEFVEEEKNTNARYNMPGL